MQDSTRQDSTQQDAPTRPERGADRNERALAADDHLDPVLPSLDDGVTLLDVDGRGVPVLQSLALDHLLTRDGPALWVDTAGCARTTTLARVAPTWRLLERVHVARGFTPYQHHAAVADVPDAATDLVARDDTAADAPALLVAPVIDGRYRDADDLPREHARQLLARTLARLRRYADAYDGPVLLTRAGDWDATAADATDAADGTGDAFADIVARTADHHLRCERTAQGPRFVGDDTETLVYPRADGTLQTTLSYWRTVLHQRASAAGVQPASATPSANADATSPGPSATSTRFGDDDGTLAASPHGHGAAHEHLLSPWQHGR